MVVLISGVAYRAHDTNKPSTSGVPLVEHATGKWGLVASLAEHTSGVTYGGTPLLLGLLVACALKGAPLVSRA